MRSSTMSILSLLVLLFCISQLIPTVSVSAAEGWQDYTKAGYPTIVLIGSALILIGSLLLGRSIGNPNKSIKSHLILVILLVSLFLIGLFCVFGYTDGSMRAPIIGLQLMLQACVGIVLLLAGSIPIAAAFFVFGIWNFLCLIGALNFMNYSTPIWLMGSTGSNVVCLNYFLEVLDPDYNRCKDAGYTQFLRTIGLFAVFIEFTLISLSYLYIYDNRIASPIDGSVQVPKQNSLPAAVQAGGSAPVATNNQYNQPQQTQPQYQMNNNPNMVATAPIGQQQQQQQHNNMMTPQYAPEGQSTR